MRCLVLFTAKAILGLDNDLSHLTQLHGLHSLFQPNTNLLCKQHP